MDSILTPIYNIHARHHDRQCAAQMALIKLGSRIIYFKFNIEYLTPNIDIGNKINYLGPWKTTVIIQFTIIVGTRISKKQ